MAGITDYPAFVGAVLVFLCIPGPGNLALLLATARGGRRGGLAAGLGVILGDQLLLWLAVGGVAALLHAHPALFQALRWAGAAYLGGIGLQLLFSRPGSAPPLVIQPGHYLRQAWLITVLNPKAIFFYMAFFPLFIDPAHAGLGSFALMAASIALLTLLYCSLAVFLADALSDRLRASPRLGRSLRGLAGAALLAFGWRLLGEH